MLLDILFPKTCFSCGSFGSYVCIKCAGRIEHVSFDMCPVCRRRSLYGIVHSWCRQKSDLEGLFSVYSYRNVFGRIIKNVKYRCVREGLNNLFNTCSKARLGDLISVTAMYKTECFVPIPLHKHRQSQRGFNQAEIIAQFFSKVTGIPVCHDVMVRKIDTPQQAQKNIVADRFRNIHGAFELSAMFAKYNVRMPGSVVLVDDVWTTGATIKEAAKVLRKGGCGKIYAATLAR